jgi:hypothetical protein
MSARFDPNGIVEMSAEQVERVEIAEKPRKSSLPGRRGQHVYQHV